MPFQTSPLGIFDSGVGGISVLRAIRAQMPEELVVYFGDQGHVPYGPRSLEQIQNFSEAVTRFLLEQGVKIIVVACNAASAAALKYLRVTFPDVQIVGMEPAVKPAVEYTHTGKVGVLATPATFQGDAICFGCRALCKRRGVVSEYLSRVGAADRAGKLEWRRDAARSWKRRSCRCSKRISIRSCWDVPTIRL